MAAHKSRARTVLEDGLDLSSGGVLAALHRGVVAGVHRHGPEGVGVLQQVARDEV